MSVAATARPATPEVSAIGDLAIEGNIIPHTWYKGLRTPSDKPDLVAITILGEVLYWYRPTSRGTRKFAEELYQRSYESLAEFFGFSKRQVVLAIRRLEAQGLLRRVFKTLCVAGQVLNNVLHLAINPEAVKALTEGTPSRKILWEGPSQSVGGPTKPDDPSHTAEGDVYGEGRGDSPEDKEEILNKEVMVDVPGSPKGTWEAIKGRLELEMPRSAFQVWMQDTEGLALEAGRLVVGVRSVFCAEWLERRLGQPVLRVAKEVAPGLLEVKFHVGSRQRRIDQPARALGGM